ncbi:HAD family hydrolase [Nocardioides sp. Soil796]|uniref:HAD family hydrolase n=1 Tax=Nocardioides sp. Soil796 TaxID=1736412 RepID=UPI00190FDBCC|nr:HAD family phosphatase [Nocardioides sp. Soil796]
MRGVLFDYGGVLTTHVGESMDAWQARDRVQPESFGRVLKKWLSRDAAAGNPIHQLESGAITGDEFSRLLAAELVDVDGQELEPEGMLDRMFAGIRQAPEMYALVRGLKSAGLKVGLLSNSWANTYPRSEIDELFDPVVISGEVGLRKPDRAIYELALAQMGLAAHEVVFIDDGIPNVEGAERAGLIALRHVDAATTRAGLAELVPDLSTAGAR